MNRIGDLVQRWAEWAMACALGVMVVMVFANAAGRYVLGQGLAVSEELSRLAFVWLIMIGAVLAVRQRAHIGMDFVVLRLNPRAQRICLILSNILIVYALGLFILGGWKQTQIGIDSVLPVTGVPTAAFALAGLLAAVAMMALYLVQTWRALSGRLPDDELVQIRESPEDLPAHDSKETRANKPSAIDAWIVLPDHIHCAWTLLEGDSNYSNRVGMMNGRFPRKLIEPESTIRARQSE